MTHSFFFEHLKKSRAVEKIGECSIVAPDLGEVQSAFSVLPEANLRFDGKVRRGFAFGKTGGRAVLAAKAPALSVIVVLFAI